MLAVRCLFACGLKTTVDEIVGVRCLQPANSEKSHERKNGPFHFLHLVEDDPARMFIERQPLYRWYPQ